MSENINMRKLAKAFIEQRSEIEDRFIVYTEKYPNVIYQGLYYLNFGYNKIEPILWLRFVRERPEDMKNELYISKYVIETKDFIEFVNEVSDYIESLIGVKITAFTIYNTEDDVYIKIRGLKYSFRYYYNDLKIYESKDLIIRGGFRRFALFNEYPELKPIAEKIVEIQKRLKDEYNELESLYYMLSYDVRESIASDYELTQLEKLVHRLTVVYDDIVVPDTGMYIIRGSPLSTLSLYENLEKRLLTLIEKCKRALIKERLGITSI